jgi:hypothetical protein
MKSAMQHDPRQTTPQAPGPIGPSGFFSGVEIRPIITGVVVDFVATYVAFYAYFFVYMAQELAKEGDVSVDQIMEYMTSPEGLAMAFVIGTLATALGGFVAGWKAAGLEIKHGGLVGAGSLALSFLEQALFGETVELPEWFRMLSILVIIPAGALGGYAAEMFKVAVGLKSPGGPGWHGHVGERGSKMEDRQ